MTHKCFKCDERFSTSGKMVQHMREAHSSFVEDAKRKIDRSQESSFEAKRSAEGYEAVAKCPFCKVDCMTRRRLMRHLEVEHQDNDDGKVEPELKIIRVENDSEKRLIKQIRKERNGNSPSGSSSTVSRLLSELEKKEGKKELSFPGTIGPIRVSATSIKLPEKRYRCFWCDASFRKRGKLMDHIDMFHKVNKQQTEDEAEMLVSAIAPVTEVVPVKTAPVTTLPKKTAAVTATTKLQPQKSSGRRRTLSSKKSSSKSMSVDQEYPEPPNSNSCKFICMGSITEVQRLKPVPKKEKINGDVRSTDSDNCIFFTKKDANPLPPLKAEDSKPNTPEASTSHQPLSQELTHEVSRRFSQLTTDARVDFTSTDSSQLLTSQAAIAFLPEYLQRPQPIYPTFDTTISHYHQQMLLNSNQVYLSQQELEQTMRLLNYQRQQPEGANLTNALQPHNYLRVPVKRDQESPLDLTVTRY